MMSVGLLGLLRSTLGLRSVFRLSYGRCVLNEARLLGKNQKNYVSKTSYRHNISISAKIMSVKNNVENEITKEDMNRSKTLNRINESLEQLGPMVESEIKFAKAVILEEERDDKENFSYTNAKLSNSSQTVELFGTPDPSQPISSVPCPGCGAKLHCRNPGIPGYLASQIFLTSPSLQHQPCQRCQLLRSKKVALDLTVPVDKYAPIAREIRRHQALIVLLVDMTDPSNSFHHTFKQLLSPLRPMFVIGNKVDLIPKDAPGYLEHLRDSLIAIADHHGFNSHSNVAYFDVVSAKTGFRLEALISKMLHFWKLKGNVFIIGCTNSGKSTLYNSLLASDFCRSAATEVLSRATVSTWPGTTLSLLKFPIVNPKPTKLKEREGRLRKKGSGGGMEKDLMESLKMRDTPDLHSPLSTTFLSPTQEALQEQHTDVIIPSYSLESDHATADELQSHCGLQGAKEYLSLKVRKYDDSSFKFWCHDTPGLVNQDQVVNLLSAEELALTTVTSKQLQPTILLLRPSQTVFVSGLARIDYLEGKDAIHLSLYTSNRLPILTTPTHQADSLHQQHIGTAKIGVPTATNNDNDPRRLPPLEGIEMQVLGVGLKQAAADVVLSSIGWASVTGRLNHTIRLKAYTPQARGVCLRNTPLVRYPHKHMGKRIYGTNRYKYKKVALGSDE